MSTSLLVEYYQQLPTRRSKEGSENWKARLAAGEEAFKKQILDRYNEGTLLRLMTCTSLRTRHAATFALSLIGSMESCAALTKCLQEEDEEIRQMAIDGLWAIWFRADSEENNEELKRLVALRDRSKALAGLDQLILRAPRFAEAYNQRGILHFRSKQFERAIADCEKTLKLNPYHFGAQAGLGQAYLQVRKNKAALKAFRVALRLHPYLDGVADAIRKLENVLGDDKK